MRCRGDVIDPVAISYFITELVLLVSFSLLRQLWALGDLEEVTVSGTTTGARAVRARLDALQAERETIWPAEQRAAHLALRRSLEAEAKRDSFVKPGDPVPHFRLPEVDGGIVDLGRLLNRGPVVLVFFRFEQCPACNAALPGYQELLAPALRELGGELIAISPQAPERLVEIKRRFGFEFAVASDVEAALIDSLGIGFAPDQAEQERLRAAGTDLGATLGTGNWTLPYPTAIVVDRSGVVRFADVHPDWMVRTEADVIIDAVRSLEAST